MPVNPVHAMICSKEFLSHMFSLVDTIPVHNNEKGVWQADSLHFQKCTGKPASQLLLQIGRGDIHAVQSQNNP